MQVTFQKLEKILRSLDYSPDEIVDFRKEFITQFAHRIGGNSLNNLDEKQEKLLAVLLTAPKDNQQQIINFFTELNSTHNVKDVIQNVFTELATATLDNILQDYLPEEKVKIQQILSEIE